MTLDPSYYWEGVREQCEDSNWDADKIKEQKMPCVVLGG